MRNTPFLCLCLLLQSCSFTQEGLVDTLKLAITGPDDITLTNQQIADMPYSSLYMRINNGQRIFVVLGYEEQGDQKWVTRDQAMMITRHGRLVKTLGLADNLININNLDSDPLLKGGMMTSGMRWTRTVGWTEQGNYRADTATSLFSRQADEVLKIAGNSVSCQVWREQVIMAGTGKRWDNTFWIDSRTGQVRQSIQTLGADYFTIETTILKLA